MTNMLNLKAEGAFSWHILGLLVLTEHHLNATGYLSIVPD